MNNQAAQTMPELPPSFARVHNDGYWTLRVRDTAEFIVHDSRQTPAQEVYSSGQMRDMYQQGYAATVAELRAEVDRLNAIINTPQANDFLRAVSTEAEHQRQRWGSEHDAGKAPADWFWLVGCLAGKALHAHAAGDTTKAEHHIITTAAALANWHLAMFGKTDMRPGIDGGSAMQQGGGGGE